MIKRIIGVLFALVTLATIFFAVMNYGNYRSMLGANSESSAEPSAEQAEVTDAAETDAVEPADTLVELSGVAGSSAHP